MPFLLTKMGTWFSKRTCRRIEGGQGQHRAERRCSIHGERKHQPGNCRWKGKERRRYLAGRSAACAGTPTSPRRGARGSRGPAPPLRITHALTPWSASIDGREKLKETRRKTAEFLLACVYLGRAPLPGQQGAQEICRGRLPSQRQQE